MIYMEEVILKFIRNLLQCYKVTFIHPIYNREIEIEIDYKWLQNIYAEL